VRLADHSYFQASELLHQALDIVRMAGPLLPGAGKVQLNGVQAKTRQLFIEVIGVLV